MHVEFFLHRLKICAEELENCEKKLERSLLELLEWQENLTRRRQGLLVETKDLEEVDILGEAAELNTQWEELAQVVGNTKQQEELAQAVRRVKLLKTELLHIIRIYHTCEETVRAECKKLHRNCIVKL